MTERPLADEQFQQIYSIALKHFPVADQISNPILTARPKGGGEIFGSPVFIQFMNIETTNFDSDYGKTKEIARVYFSNYKSDRITQIAIRLVSLAKAVFKDNERLLVRDGSLKLTPHTIKEFDADGEIKTGIRVVYQRNQKRYDLKIEPYFKNLEYNYVDLNVVMPELDVPSDKFDDLVYETVHYLVQGISRIIP